MVAEPCSVEDLEHTLAVVARAVINFGPAYAPILKRLEAELEHARREDPVAHAKRLLAALDV